MEEKRCERQVKNNCKAGGEAAMRLRRFRLSRRDGRNHGHSFAGVNLRPDISYTTQSQNSSRNLRLNPSEPARRRSQNPPALSESISGRQESDELRAPVDGCPYFLGAIPGGWSATLP